MIKLNDICIQYTAWYRRETRLPVLNTHTPWSTRMGPARMQHGENHDETTRGFGRSARGIGIGESEGRERERGFSTSFLPVARW